MLKRTYDVVELIQLALKMTQSAAHRNKLAGSMKARNFFDSCETVTFKGGTCGSSKEIELYEKYSVRVLQSV